MPGAAEPERGTVRVAWQRADLESLVDRAEADAIAFSFDRGQLYRALDESEFEAHGIRETMAILTVAAAAAVAASNAGAQLDVGNGGTSSSAGAAVVASHDELTLADRGIGVQAAAVIHDEATLAARGVEATAPAAVHDEATLAARGVEPAPLAAVHDEATLAARGVGITPAVPLHDEATLVARGVEATSVPAVRDEATLAARGVETPAPDVADGGSSFELPSVDAGTAAAIGGLAGAGLVIAAAGFAASRRDRTRPV